MKKLVYIPSGLPTPELEILLSKSQEILDNKKNKLIILNYSKDACAPCPFNLYSQKSIYRGSQEKLDKGIKKLNGNFKLLSVPNVNWKKTKLTEFEKKNILNKKKIKLLNFKKIDIGLSSWATYLDGTRDLNFEGFFARNLMLNIFKSSKSLVNDFDKILREEKVKEIFMYNGRRHNTRPLLRLANKKKIKLQNLEHVTFLNNSKGVRLFKNFIPNDLVFLKKQILNHWTQNKGSDEDVKKYFLYRKNNLLKNNQASHVFNQSKSLLPYNWNHEKINIVYFISSQDEYAANGGEWLKSVYTDQNESVRKISQDFLKNNKENKFHLWIRMHPYLKGVKWKFNTDIYKYSKFRNIDVIKPESPISTYRLMEKCDKVLGYHSITTVEANFWRKPSMLLGRQYFENVNACHKAKKHNDVIKFIFTDKYKLKPKENSLKIASFWIHGGVNQKYFGGNMLKGYKFNKQEIKLSNLNKILFYFGKFLEKFIYNKINYYFRNLKV